MQRGGKCDGHMRMLQMNAPTKASFGLENGKDKLTFLSLHFLKYDWRMRSDSAELSLTASFQPCGNGQPSAYKKTNCEVYRICCSPLVYRIPACFKRSVSWLLLAMELNDSEETTYSMAKSQLRVKQIRFLSILLNVTNKYDDLVIYYESVMWSPRTKALVTMIIVKVTRKKTQTDNFQVRRVRLEINN